MEFVSVEQSQTDLTDYNTKFSSRMSETSKLTEQIIEKLTKQQIEFQNSLRKFEEDFEKAKLAQSHLASILSDHQRLTADFKLAEEERNASVVELTKLGDTSSTLKEQRFKLKTKVDELREILSAATKIEDLSEGRLKAYVFDDQISEQHLNALVDLCERCGIRDFEERCAERIKEVTSDNFAVWEQMLDRLVSLRKRCLQFDTIKNVNENLLEELRGVLGFKLTINQAIQI